MQISIGRFRISKWSAIGFLIVLLGAFGRFQALAQSTEFPAYIMGLQIVNLSGQVNLCEISAYDEAGNLVFSRGITLEPLEPQTTILDPVMPALNQSAIVTCESPYAMISNVLASDFSAAGSYVIPVAGAAEVSLPLLNKDNSGYTTWYSVQNLGEEEATVNIRYSDGAVVDPLTIPPFSLRNIFQSEEAHNLSIFAAGLESDQPIRAAVLQESSDIIFAYTGVPAAGGTIPPPVGMTRPASGAVATVSSENPIFPLVNVNNAGYVTGIQILNGGDQATNVTVSYTPSAVGSACTETRRIPAGASRTFALAAFANGAASDCLAQERFIGSAVVTGNSTAQPLTGIVNQLLPGVKGEAYVGFAPEAATNAVAMPLIMDRNSGYFTGFSLQQVGGPASDVSCIFSNSSYTVSDTLQPGEALVDIQANKIGDGYIGSCVCRASNVDTKIVAVVNQLGADSNADQFLVYEALPLPDLP
jgi:hypothetical protein